MSAKMSKSATQKLNQFLWRQRLKQVGLVVLAIGLVGGAMTYKTSRADPITAIHDLSGVVALTQPTGHRNVYLVNIHLQDGRDIQATSTNGAPLAGAHVDVQDRAYASGRHIYNVRHIAP